MSGYRSRLLVQSLEDRRVPAIFTVTNAGNNFAGSLRQAITDANALPGLDTIDFAVPAGTFQLLILSPLTITDPVNIDGAGLNGVPIMSNNARTFIIAVPGAGAESKFADLNIEGKGAQSSTRSGGFDVSDDTVRLINVSLSNCSGDNGGAIAVAGGKLTMTACTISNCLAINGGGIYIEGGTATITGSTFTNNSAKVDTGTFGVSNGGGVYMKGGTLSVADCTLSNNRCTSGYAQGGAIGVDDYTANTVTVLRSTISNNQAWLGGGIGVFGGNPPYLSNFDIRDSAIIGNASIVTDYLAYGAGGGIGVRCNNLTMVNCTVSGNSAVQQSYGGGIVVSATGKVSLVHCTVTKNSAGSSGGVSLSATSSPYFADNIIAQNTAKNDPDIYHYAAITITGNNNLIGQLDGSATTFTGQNQIGTPAAPIDAKLAPLAANGGPTQTHALLPGSPAINAGDNPTNLVNDQRGTGLARVVGKSADIGAFELQPLPPEVASVNINDGSAQRSRVTSITVTFDQAVTLPVNPATAFQLVRSVDGAVVNLAGSVVGNAVTLTFTGGAIEAASLADGRYTLTVMAAQVSGGLLDGNYDAIPGDDFVLAGTASNKLFRLFGDAEGDGDVDNGDFVAFRAAFGTGASIFDSDGDGDTDIDDFVAFRGRFGVILP